MNSYCLRHTRFTIGLGVAFFLVGCGAVIFEQTVQSGSSDLGATGVLSVLFSLVVAVWPKVPRLRIYDDSFETRGFLNGSNRKYLWSELLSVEQVGESSFFGFVAVTPKKRVRIARNTAGVREVQRLFELIARNPENATTILEDDYCDPGVPIHLRRNWQLAIGPAIGVMTAFWFLWAALNYWTESETLFGIVLFSSGGVAGCIYMFQFINNPFKIRLEGGMLTFSGLPRKRTIPLWDIDDVRLLGGTGIERIEIRLRDGSRLFVRIVDFFGYPMFDRAFYPIRFCWLKYRAAMGEESLLS